MNLIDSSAWIAYFESRPAASSIEKYMEKPGAVLIPSLVIYEVYRKLHQKLSAKEALFFISQMEDGNIVVSLDSDLSLRAAEISLEFKLGMADAIIYSTALAHKAKLITLDNDFRNLPDCLVIK